jgi:Uma2 family endonuclease
MVLQTKYTVDDFEAFIRRPENADRLFELMYGEITEVSPGRTRYSQINHIIVHAVLSFCEQHNLPAHTSGGDGAYRIQGNVVAPDFAYKRTPMSEEYPDPEPPLWVVEVISPTDEPEEIRKKRQIYREAGILMWETYFKSKTIDVYPPGKPPYTATIDDVLDVGDVIPGFTLAVKKVFGV